MFVLRLNIYKQFYPRFIPPFLSILYIIRYIWRHWALDHIYFQKSMYRIVSRFRDNRVIAHNDGSMTEIQ